LALFVIALTTGVVVAATSADSAELPRLALSQDANTGLVTASADAQGLGPSHQVVVCVVGMPMGTVLASDRSGASSDGTFSSKFE
jgi:hypothetical protein